MAKRILVTAGATQVPIDQVRAITNIFHGRTGTEIAKHFAAQGHFVTLITSNPILVNGEKTLNVIPYKTFNELAEQMEQALTQEYPYDIVIHSAAVSDYQAAGVFVRNENGQLTEIDSSAKISSAYQELFIRTVPTFKIIDKIRQSWGFKGKLVKFKLQVGLSEEELIKIARKSRDDSSADIIVANCLDWSHIYAILLDGTDNLIKVSRDLLAKELERRLV